MHDPLLSVVKISTSAALMLAAGAAHAQSVNPAATTPGQTRRASPWLPKSNPNPTSQVRTMILPQLPASMVQLDTAPSYVNNPLPPLDPPESFGVLRRAPMPRGATSCASFVDRIDLAPLRRSKYVLTSVQVTLYGTIGIAAGSPVRISGLDAAGAPLSAETPVSSYRTLVVQALTCGNFQQNGLPRFCSSGYRLHLTVKGLRGIDPLTGARVPI